MAGVVNSLIAAEYAAGASISELAERWGIDPRQVVERISGPPAPEAGQIARSPLPSTTMPPSLTW